MGFSNNLGNPSDYGDHLHYGMAMNLWESGLKLHGLNLKLGVLFKTAESLGDEAGLAEISYWWGPL